ncbi:MAG: VanW family protein [Clostridiales bacterium]|nr:VanW family protein [Clostridiales bacterium]
MKKTRILLAALLLLSMLITQAPAFAGSPGETVSTPTTGLHEDRIFNIGHAIQKLNNLILLKGQVFSFNDLVGPRNKASGFRHIEDERGKAIFGGGVSQIAATMDIALRAYGNDINFLERHTYGNEFQDNYLPSGKNAVRVEYSTGKNYAFTNNFNNIKITLWLADNQLNCAIKVWNMGPQPDDQSAPALDRSVFGSLESFDPASGIAVFKPYEILEGETARNYLMNELGYDEEDVEILYSGMDIYEHIIKPLNYAPIKVNVDQVNWILQYQPSGELGPSLEGIPSNGADFRALYKNNPDKLLTSYTYFIDVDYNGKPGLIKQEYPAHGDYHK